MRAVLLSALWWFACPSGAQRIAISIQTYSANHNMVDSSRESWRKGIATVVITNGTTARRLPSPADNEIWFEAPDLPHVGWNTPSENRYTAQIRYANQSLDFDWLLAGDDDTVFLVDNVVNLVRDLDPDDLYYLTDALQSDAVYCTLPEEASEHGAGGCVVSPPATPCTRAVLEHPSVCGANKTRFTEGHIEQAPGSIWGFGQVGFVVSRGTLRSISEEDIRGCEYCNATDFCHQNNERDGVCTGGGCYGGGDVRIGECLWRFAGNRVGLGPTVPYSHRGVKVFGHNIHDIIAHAERVIAGQHCDETCHFVLDRVVSTDIHHATPSEYRRLCHHFSKTYAHAKRILHGTHNASVRFP
jgi:hypothetical protein